MKKIVFSFYFGLSILVVGAQQNHVVKKGETLYSIAKRYNLTQADLKKMNPALVENPNLKIGQSISLAANSVSNASQTTLNRSVPAKVHTISKGETLYALCKKYGVTMDELKKWNSLRDLSVHPGQRIIVSKVNQQALYKPIAVSSTPDTPYREEDVRERVMMTEIRKSEATLKPETLEIQTPKPDVAKPVFLTDGLRTSSSNAADYPAIFNQYSYHGYKIKKSKGAANYLADATSGNQNMAFYNDAETGSIVRVTNLMNKKTIFVKVVGKVPPTDASKEITIKLSNKAAQDLGVEDEKFLVEVASFFAN